VSAVGLDLSLTSSGVARLHPDGAGYTWTIASTGHRNDTLTERADRIRITATAIVTDINDGDQVVLEAPSYGSTGSSSWDRAGLWWAVVTRLTARRIPLHLCPPSTRAKWATGSGRADKAAVAASMAKLFPAIEISNSDESDALALAHICAVHLGHQVPQLARHNLDQLGKVRWSPPTLEEN
jgi:Holliday junction resolvasome RuvABC endonuclease subunit